MLTFLCMPINFQTMRLTNTCESIAEPGSSKLWEDCNELTFAIVDMSILMQKTFICSFLFFHVYR